jgi:WD40 repeat protein
MSASPSLQLLIALSDTSISFYQYIEEARRLDQISTEKLNGVATSSDFASGTFAVGTTVGECHFFGDVIGNSSLHNCGIHCVRLFEYTNILYATSAADDGAVAIWRVSSAGAFPVVTIKKGHVGGVKAIAVEVVDGICRICSVSCDQAVRVDELELFAGLVRETCEYSGW